MATADVRHCSRNSTASQPFPDVRPTQAAQTEMVYPRVVYSEEVRCFAHV